MFKGLKRLVANKRAEALEKEVKRLRDHVYELEKFEGQMADLENLAGWLAHDVPVLQVAVEWAKKPSQPQAAIASVLRHMWSMR